MRVKTVGKKSMHLNPWVNAQKVKSKAIADYIVSGKCVIRECLTAETIASLKYEASQVPLDNWIGIFNHDDDTLLKQRSMHKASVLGHAVMTEVLISLIFTLTNVSGHSLSHKRYISWPRCTGSSIRMLTLVSLGEQFF